MIILKYLLMKPQKRFTLNYNFFKSIFFINNELISSFFHFSIFWFFLNKFYFFIVTNKFIYYSHVLNLILNLKLSNYYYKLLKIYGLGFRLTFIEDEKCLRLDFGWSHVVYYTLPINIFFLKKTSDILLYSSNIYVLGNFFKKIINSYTRSPYHIKGVFSLAEKIKKKIGKQRQK